MRYVKSLLMFALIVFFIVGCSSASKLDKANASDAVSNRPKLTHEVSDASASVVYWTKGTDADAVLKAYEATGNKLNGKIAIKVSFESPDGPYLDPQLLSKLQAATNGTFCDSNGFTAPRDTTSGHLKVAADHGFTNVGPVDILDADGSIDIPVKNGKYLQFHRIGAHFADYDSAISVVKFKAHHIQKYGGTLKNLTICLADTSGKANIHSAGATQQGWSPAELHTQAQAFADAAKAAVDYRAGKWVYINVINGFRPDDKCANTGEEPSIGIIASTDPVAVDQAAVDFVYGTASSDSVRKEWEEYHSVYLLQYAEERGVGQRHYQLKEI